MDRLSRDAPDVLETIKTLADRGAEVIVPQLGRLDLPLPAGKLTMAVQAAVAEMERDLIVERTQAGLARAKVDCKTLGRPSKTTPEQRQAIAQGSCEQIECESAGDALRRFSRYSPDNHMIQLKSAREQLCPASRIDSKSDRKESYVNQQSHYCG